MNTLAKRTDLIEWTPEQLDLIKRTVAKDCTADETKLFLYQCSRTGLDPLARQIYAVKRGGKMVIQTAIDGYRLVADRTGYYAGSDDAVFTGAPQKDLCASVTIWKMVSGQRCPFSASARWGEYYPGDSQGTMWKKMPHTMLAKCAEALALRKAFPADLSGVYTAEEMDQATVVDVKATVVPAKQIEAGEPEPPKPEHLKMTIDDIQRVYNAGKFAGLNYEGLVTFAKDITGAPTIADMDKGFMSDLLAALELKASLARPTASEIAEDVDEVFGPAGIGTPTK